MFLELVLKEIFQLGQDLCLVVCGLALNLNHLPLSPLLLKHHHEVHAFAVLKADHRVDRPLFVFHLENFLLNEALERVVALFDLSRLAHHLLLVCVLRHVINVVAVNT